MGAIDRGSGLLPKVAAIILVIALLLHLIALGAPNWAKTDESQTERKEHIGLWKYCTYPVGGGQSCDDFVNIITGGQLCQFQLTKKHRDDPRVLWGSLGQMHLRVMGKCL